MFAQLSDLSRVRSWREAVGFYLAYLAVGFVLLFAVGFAAAIVLLLGPGLTMTNPQRHAFGQQVGVISIILYVLALCLLTIHRKRLGLPAYLVAIASIVLASLGGGILGILPAAWLTTWPARAPKPPAAPG